MDFLLRGESSANDELIEDAKAYGVILPEEMLQPRVYRLWAELAPAVDLFIRNITQWRAGSDGVIGLDYGVVLQMAQLYGIGNLPSVMEDLQLLELRARELINKAGRRKS